MPPDKPHWKELFTDVVTSGLCTGCAACIVACPYDVLEYDTDDGAYKPVPRRRRRRASRTARTARRAARCARGRARGSATGRPRSTRSASGASAPPRRSTASPTTWCSPARRTPSSRRSARTAASSPRSSSTRSSTTRSTPRSSRASRATARPGGRCPSSRAPAPRSSRPRARATPTRPTCSRTARPIEAGAERIGLVGMGCMTSAPGAMAARKAGKIARRLSLTIGLMCSKTFDDAIFEELFEARYGMPRARITKMNIKGVFQLWLDRRLLPRGPPQRGARTGRARGARSARTSPLSTPTCRRAASGRSTTGPLSSCARTVAADLLAAMVTDGAVEVRPGDDDPGAIALLRKLARVSRRRWPATAVAAPGRLPAPAG